MRKSSLIHMTQCEGRHLINPHTKLLHYQHEAVLMPLVTECNSHTPCLLWLSAVVAVAWGLFNTRQPIYQVEKV